MQRGMASTVGREESKPRVAEFFAGVGLVRMALEEAGFRVVFANDVSARKREMYKLNFGGDDFVLADIRAIQGGDVPDIEAATASFPCTDLSLAGGRAGLRGSESGLLAEFLRVLEEMGERRPGAVLLENVSGFATSNGGADLLATLEALNKLGYYCDVAALDARRFVPQSRPRLFVIAGLDPPAAALATHEEAPGLRPAWASRLLASNGYLRTFSLPVPPLPERAADTLDDVVEAVAPADGSWWNEERTAAFVSSLSRINIDRAAMLRGSLGLAHATAYRRTRAGKAVWEIRGDNISGCLRTTRGGSSKQALVEGGGGELRVRWMTAREYARLQGAPEFEWGAASDLQARFALGDAVCVPAVAWLARHFLMVLVGKPARANGPATWHEVDQAHVY